MQKLDSLNQVAEFHQLFDAPILVSPQIPSKERAQLRVALLEEELKELKEAIKNNDLVEVADALCDLQYVLSGAVLEFGMGDKFVELFNEVHRSNLSKACLNESEAKETQEYYESEGTSTYCVSKAGRINIHRSADHKVLKNKYYSKANLEGILK